MKNFKKVISAVVALALSATTLVSASFTDVADTASYAEAINVLSSLGIVNGYEDGTFKPEGEITRAEAATMVVGALNMTEDAVNAAGTSQFADVNEKAAWATGYINVGVAQGFINGMGDGTFAPQANVTYAQMCVMLTSIAGYGEYASNGGYPTGYTNMAASTGINKGVAVADNTALTRGQVAQMIYNTLTVPMLGVSEYNLTGNTYAQLDGKKNEFKSLLSDKFDGYVATVMITGTPVADGLDNDEVKFKIQKADWWYEGTTTTPYPTTEIPGFFAEGVDVNGNNKQIGKAVFVANEDDEPVMVYFAATTKTDKKEFDADSYVLQTDLKDGTNRYDDNGKIRFDSKYYGIQSDADLYVNGKELTTFSVTEANLDTYLGEAIGTITLIDTDESTDGYNNIFVDVWQVAKVFGVEYENSETTITMSTKSTVGTAYETIVITDEAVEDGETIVTVEKDGQAVELTSIAKDDIIAFKTAIDGGSAQLKDPAKIEILVSDDTINGKVTGIDEEDETYTINGTEYSMVNWSNSFVDVAKTYTITLDPFGRMVEKTLDGSSELFGIFVSAADDTIRLVLADGTSKSYTMESGAGKGAYANKNADEIETYIENISGLEVYDRVVSYKVRSSTGEIMEIKPASGLSYAPWTAAEKYVARTGRLGGQKISADTAIIDASKAVAGEADTAASYIKFNNENLKDGAEYYYAIVTTDTYTNLVLIKQIGTKINSDSRFAVVKKAPSLQYTDDGDEVEAVTVLLDGADAQLLFNRGVYDNIYNVDDPTPKTSLQVGDVFFYEVDAYGYVDKVFRVYNSTAGFTNLHDAIEDVIKTGSTYYVAEDFIETSSSSDEFWAWDLDNSSARADIQLVEGYVVEAESDVITFTDYLATNITKIDTTKLIKDDADRTNGETNVVMYSVTEDTAIYVYDANAENKNDKFTAKKDASVLTPAGLAKFLDDGVYNVTNITPNATKLNDAANYAVAMIVDGEIVAIYVVKA